MTCLFYIYRLDIPLNKYLSSNPVSTENVVEVKVVPLSYVLMGKQGCGSMYVCKTLQFFENIKLTDLSFCLLMSELVVKLGCA